MKTKIISLNGDLRENLYQLGLKEKKAFKKLESRVLRLLSTNTFLRQGQDILNRARTLLKKKEEGLFQECIKAYADGLGIDSIRYMSFLSLFELAAHYGQLFPELKGLLPGCTSVFSKTEGEISHTRLIDFPLIGIFEESPTLYYWRSEGKPTLMSYSCEGLAPLFFQVIHESGMSLALHHKPGLNYNREGESIFEIIFETLFKTQGFFEIRKELKERATVTKWCLLLVENKGQVQVIDMDGFSMNHESYNLNETSPLIFTNIPLQKDLVGFDSFLRFSSQRQEWLKEKLKRSQKKHILDLLTDVEDQKERKWLHPAATLSTVAAYHVNLTQGTLDLKEGEGALVQADKIIRFSLADQSDSQVLKKEEDLSDFEKAWKRASLAQSAFDQGEYEIAYHELQMAQALMPHSLWKEIFSFYLCVWDFKFISNSKELALIYKKLRKLNVPDSLKNQWHLFCMRFEKRLGLVLTVEAKDLSPYLVPLFEQEKAASKPLFATWMKLLYPRLEILDIFSPHHK